LSVLFLFRDNSSTTAEDVALMNFFKETAKEGKGELLFVYSDVTGF
jgi:hypothetical protein